MTEQERTEFDRVMRAIKDNHLTARIAVLAIIVAGALGIAGSAWDLWERLIPAQASRAEHTRLTNRGRDQDSRIAKVAADDKSFSPASFEEYVHNAMTYMRPDQTDLQRQAYVDSMQGRRVVWTAPVLGIRKISSGGLSLTLEHDGKFAWFNFDPSDFAQLVALNAGDVVQVTGVIGSWEGTYVELNDCRILRVLADVRRQPIKPNDS
jgi:hypothetical protein